MMADDVRADRRVRSHHLPFVRIQAPCLLQNAVRDPDLAHVVHRRRIEQIIGPGRTQAGGQAEQMCVVAHPDHVQPGFVVLVFRRQSQALDDLEPGLLQILEPDQRQVRAHPGQHDRGAERFTDVVDPAGFEACDLVGRVGQRGDEDHRDPGRRRVALQASTDLVPRHIRHHHVQQDQVRRLRARQFDRALAILRKQQPILALQYLAQQQQIAAFVVDGQDQGRVGWRCHCRSSGSAAALSDSSTAATIARADSKSKSSIASDSSASRFAST